MIKTAKLALEKGELKIAENSLAIAMRTVLLEIPCKRDPKPYLYLAEILERKAEDKKVDLPQRQRYLLQAAALYNFVRNFVNTEGMEDGLSESKTLLNIVSRQLHDIQDNMVRMVGGNPLQCKFDAALKRNKLETLRDEIRKSLESMESRVSLESLNRYEVQQMLNGQMEVVKFLSDNISVKMRQFLAVIINECLELLGTPPCDYEVIVLGSLARNEMTPYSDFEWAILTNSEEEECKVFFRNLTNLVHLQVGQ